MFRRALLLGGALSVAASLAVLGLGSTGRAAVDDGYFDRWTITSATYTPGANITIGYTREWVHPSSGTITGFFTRTDPQPEVELLTFNSVATGQTGGPQGFTLGANSSEVSAPGTYLLRREIKLGDGTLTYRQDIVITLPAGGGAATWSATEELFIPAEPPTTTTPTTTPEVEVGGRVVEAPPAPVIAPAKTTG